MSSVSSSSAASAVDIGRPSVQGAENERGSSLSGGPAARRSRLMKARDFEEKFDAGADVSGDVDWGKARRPNLEPKRVNVDFPAWVVEALDREARRLGVIPKASLTDSLGIPLGRDF